MGTRRRGEFKTQNSHSPCLIWSFIYIEELQGVFIGTTKAPLCPDIFVEEN